MEDENSPALRAGVDFRGTPNATQPVLEHIKPGKKRAPLLRYIRFNLPKTTRLLLIAVIAVIGAASAAVALSNHEPFPFATPVLWSICGAAPHLDMGITHRAVVSVGLHGRPAVCLEWRQCGIRGDLESHATGLHGLHRSFLCIALRDDRRRS